MTAKRKGISTIYSKDKSAFLIDNTFKSSSRPSQVRLIFRNLKAKTKYKIFLVNSDGDRVEDVTPFCTPYGESILYNNDAETFLNIVSTECGEIFVDVMPIGVDSVNLTNDNWKQQWEFNKTKTLFNDVGRQNFTIVESAKVTSPNSSDKLKPISITKPPVFTLPILPSNPPKNQVKQIFNADFVQTFFIDPNMLNEAKSVDVTDITLYVRNKPSATMNRSLRNGPGITVCIVDTLNGNPVLSRQYTNSIKSVAWSEIAESADATIGTIIEFDSPVRLEAGRTYGIAIAVDDSDYTFWTHTKGHVLVNTNEISVGSNRDFRGSFFTKTNSNVKLNNSNFDVIYTEKESVDLKFDLHVAEYDVSTPVDIHFVNTDQEFLVVSNTNHNWVGSEFVYKETANATGNVSIGAAENVLIGNGTNFLTDISKGDLIVVTNGVNTQVLEIDGIQGTSRATLKNRATFSMAGASYKVTPIAKVDYYDKDSRLLILRNSTANSTHKFESGDILKGIRSAEEAIIDTVGVLNISVFNTDMIASIPSQFRVKSEYKFAVANGSSYNIHSDAKEMNLLEPNYVNDYNAFILSKSIEAENSANLYDEDNFGNTASKSSKFTLTFEHDSNKTKTYETPVIDISSLSIATKKWAINNDATNEHTNRGNALTKHISQKLTFANGLAAEDIRVIQNAYRPLGTDIRVYAKIIHSQDSEPFDSKSWTELQRIRGENEYSEITNRYDYREFEYGFPKMIPVENAISGSITTQSGNNIVIGNGTQFTSELSEGDVIQIYSEFFNDNYGFFVVVAIDSDTQLQLNEAITNNDIVGDSFKIARAITPKTAFNNPLNQNIVRYFGENGEVYDGYSTVAIKTVLLSENSLIVPRVDDYRVIGVSV